MNYPTNRTYEYINDADGLAALLSKLDKDKPHALDFEGWDYKARLVQICNDDVWAVVDFGKVSENNWFYEVSHWFEDYIWIAFYSKHEKTVFANHDSNPTVWDLAHLWRAMEGGGHLSLKALVAKKDVLGYEMSKEEQASAWNDDDLTLAQVEYAALDAIITWDAWTVLYNRSTPEQRKCFDMLDSMTDAVLEMERNGLKLDVKHHGKLVDQWRALSTERTDELRTLITEDDVPNLNSNKQLSALFAKLLPDDFLDVWPRTEKTGDLSMKNKDLLNMAGASGDTPLADTLRLLAERSTLEKYLSSFGDTLINKAKLDRKHGRVHANYNVAAAITCRFSSSNPNLQQIPRDRDFFGERLSIRTGFVAAPGNLLVSYDYSGIEMVMIAILSGDEQLLHDVIYGDPHAVMGEYVLGRPLDKSVVADYEIRQSMKAVNFGIVYGTTALGLAGRQGWTFEFAQSLLTYWAERYPVAWALRYEMQKQARETGYINMVDGGSIFVGKQVGLTKCANYPVQRAALAVMARAITLHHESMCDLRHKYPSDANRIMMCSTIHDALLDEAPKNIAPLVMQTMKADMLAAYRDVFPELDAPDDRLLEGGMGRSWGQLEEI